MADASEKDIWVRLAVVDTKLDTILHALADVRVHVDKRVDAAEAKAEMVHDNFQKQIDELKTNKVSKDQFEPLNAAFRLAGSLVIAAIIGSVLVLIGLKTVAKADTANPPAAAATLKHDG